MNKEDIKELQEYNLKYLEARNNEEIFGGDYTSEVELEYVKKENQRLQQELERNKNIIDELEKYLNEVMESYGYETDITDRIEKIAVKNILNKLKELKERNKIDE